MAAILKMVAILNFFNWPHITGENFMLVAKMAQFFHQTAALKKLYRHDTYQKIICSYKLVHPPNNQLIDWFIHLFVQLFTHSLDHD